jgi:hypothetical protein
MAVDRCREVTQVVAMPRVSGSGSRGWFLLSVFGCYGISAEAVILGLKDMAALRQPIQQCGRQLGTSINRRF